MGFPRAQHCWPRAPALPPELMPVVAFGGEKRGAQDEMGGVPWCFGARFPQRTWRWGAAPAVRTGAGLEPGLLTVQRRESGATGRARGAQAGPAAAAPAVAPGGRWGLSRGLCSSRPSHPMWAPGLIYSAGRESVGPGTGPGEAVPPPGVRQPPGAWLKSSPPPTAAASPQKPLCSRGQGAAGAFAHCHGSWGTVNPCEAGDVSRRCWITRAHQLPLPGSFPPRGRSRWHWGGRVPPPPRGQPRATACRDSALRPTRATPLRPAAWGRDGGQTDTHSPRRT